MGNSFVTTKLGVWAMEDLRKAIAGFYALPEISRTISHEHTKKTPVRIAEAWAELYQGVFVDPKSTLATKFDADGYDEIIYVNNIKFVSSCAHHGLPFFGKAHFAYLPGKKIVGLSKIPRLVQAYALRPQVQEKLTQEIVDTFYQEVKPRGCGMVMEAYHLCVMIRGTKNDSAYTKTTALKGMFKRNASMKAEFLDGVRQSGLHVWP